MNKIQIVNLAFALLASVAVSQLVTPTAPSCQPTATLTALGLTAQTSAIVNNGTCKNYYATNGACAQPGQVIAAMNSKTDWFKNQALNSNLFGLQYINATIYFQTLAGIITSSTVVNSNSSWFSSFSSFFTNLVNRATSLFYSVSNWVTSVFNNHVNAVNACFQAWNNVTNGAYCLASSSNVVPYTTNTAVSSIPVTFVVDPTSTGNALNACLPLLDSYCSLSFGISISNSALPFNNTFNWSDGALGIQDCYNFRNQTNCTSCTAARNVLWTNLFNSAWMKFVPSTATTNNLGTFLTATSAAAASTFKPVAASQTGVGFTLSASSAVTGENILVDGQNSGQPGQYFGAQTLLVGIFVTLIGLMI